MNNSQCTPQNCSGTPFSLVYTYDLLGDVTSSTNGAGVTLTDAYNLGARLTSVTSSLSGLNHPGTLFSAPQYNPAGSLLSATLGNGVNETRSYDGRLRLCAITDGSIYSLAIPSTTSAPCPSGTTNGYAPNSDILAANDSVNGNWTYGYDAFNRLISSNQNSGQTAYSYVYDRFGNRWQQNVTAGSGLSSSLGFNANNQIVAGNGVAYDASGDTTNDPVTAYSYDAEGRVTTAVNNVNGTSTYVYDAGGRRIRKTTAIGGTVDFVYDPAGHEVSQISSTGAWTRGEVYAGGRHLATYTGGTSGTTYFIHADWLGTERARSTAGGTPYETCTSLPFGDWLTCVGGDVSPMHFTGKEHDTETGLENFGARYDASSMGRFMTPDSLNTLDLSHPQKLNRYTYANNNPLSNVDVGGHCTAPAVSGGQVGICVESYIRARFLPGITNHLALAQGDDRGPNPHGGTFRTQTLLSVDPSTHEVKIQGQAAGKSCAIEGCYLGVNSSSLSKISHDDKGNTYFALTVYGENGYAANGKWGAPSGLIEMQFSFTVNSKGEVTVSNPETKGYPSASIYSYDSEGNAQDVWQETESGNIKDLQGPLKPAANSGQSAIDEDAERQCKMGNLAACD